MGGVPIRGKLVRFFHEHPGVQVYAHEIGAALNESPKRVMDGMTNLLQDGRMEGLIRVQNGGPYIYKGSQFASPVDAHVTGNKPLFEEIGKTKKGDIIIQDEHGNLYKAIELE
jgi:hypothetical protein